MIMVADQQPNVISVRLTPDYGKFIIEPLPHGFGTTLGNALRRVLLGSVPGVAITTTRIEGVAHEFSTVPHVHENMTELILNLKDVAFEVVDEAEFEAKDEHPPKPLTGRIEAEGQGEVTGADLVVPDAVRVVNPELHLATVTDDEGRLVMEVQIARGVGYVPADQHGVDHLGLGAIPIDSLFTPVRRVNHHVESTRVGHQTDLDRLILEVWTNAAMSPKRALSEAALILAGYIRLFFDFSGEPSAGADGRDGERAGGPRNEVREAKIEELEFGQRTYNCLKKEQINTIGDLLELSEKELKAIRNLGDKSLAEIREKLENRGLQLVPDED